jgi:hypothetical protein
LAISAVNKYFDMIAASGVLGPLNRFRLGGVVGRIPLAVLSRDGPTIGAWNHMNVFGHTSSIGVADIKVVLRPYVSVKDLLLMSFLETCFQI